MRYRLGGAKSSQNASIFPWLATVACVLFTFWLVHGLYAFVKPGLHVGRKHKRMEIVPFSCVVLMLASLRCTCKPGRRKHKHKRKHKALMLAPHRFYT